MKKILSAVLFIIIFLTLIYYQEPIQKKLINLVSDIKPLENGKINGYARKDNFNFVQTTDVLKPSNKKELYNLYYTVLDGGYTTYQFYCNRSYKTCLNDVNDLSRDDLTLSNVNSFVAPFNSFKQITTSYNNYGLVTMKIEKAYLENQITESNNKVTEIENKLIKPTMDLKTKIRVVHDYLINNTTYDQARADHNVITYQSDIAYGTLIQGYAICSGYTDAMALFLNRWNVPNYRITSDDHVWNMVYINGKWLHLDLTFDDPISDDGKNNLTHNYFLITTEHLRILNDTEHFYDENVFSEAK